MVLSLFLLSLSRICYLFQFSIVLCDEMLSPSLQSYDVFLLRLSIQRRNPVAEQMPRPEEEVLCVWADRAKGLTILQPQRINLDVIQT